MFTCDDDDRLLDDSLILCLITLCFTFLLSSISLIRFFALVNSLCPRPYKEEVFDCLLILDDLYDRCYLFVFTLSAHGGLVILLANGLYG